MRKPNLDLWKYQKRKSVYSIRERHKLSRECRRRRAARKKGLRDTHVKVSKPRNVTVSAPAKIVFHDHHESRSKFLDFIELVVVHLQKGNKVTIDLSKIEVLHPCGLLLLLSHVRTWTTQFPAQLFGAYPSDELVEQMLQSVGILDKLSLQSRTTINREEVTRWYYFKGESTDATEMIPFMEIAKERLGIQDQAALYDSMIEAITNVTHHAYEEEEAKRWWMFATLTDSHIIVAVYDNGRSIPGTLLEKPGVRDQVRSWYWGRKKSDARILHAAMGGKSRTKLCYRGKGLPEMLDSTRNMLGSSLSIYSRHGIFHCNSTTSVESSDQLPNPIDGTLLLWSLKT